MTELRVGDNVFGQARKDGRKPKAAVGSALTDEYGKLWATVPKFFFEESGGLIFTGRDRKTLFSESISSARGVKLPPGGFVAVQVANSVQLSPHTGTQQLDPPEMLASVDIVGVSGKVSGFSNNFKLYGGEVESRITLISYNANADVQPNAGQICAVNGATLGLVVGVSHAKRLAAIVPWHDLISRFEKLGLTPAPADLLRQRNQVISQQFGSAFEMKVANLTDWLEAIPQTAREFRGLVDTESRLVGAIEALSHLAPPVNFPRARPKGFGGVQLVDWNDLCREKQIQDIAINNRGEVVSVAKAKPDEIFVTVDHLIRHSIGIEDESRNKEVVT